MVLENLVATIGKTKLADFISNPKGSRQFQQFIKLGNKELRNGAIEAICKQVPELAMRNIYAILTLEKIVTYGLKSDEEFTTEKILKPVMTDRKTVEVLLFHRLGCKFLNKLYMHPLIKPALKKQLCQLVMIPRSVEIFGDSKEKLRQFYLETCARCVDKELLGFEIVQRLMRQAVMDFPVSEDRQFNEDILNICADGLAHLLSSRDGVVVVVKLLGVASAKQKKNLVKELKGKFGEMSRNSVTCVVILRLLECVDDTVLVAKSVLGELIAVGIEHMKDASGRMPFMYVLEGLEMKTGRCYFPPDRDLLASSAIPTSLKEKELKSSELKSKLVPLIFAQVMEDQNCAELVKDENGKDVVAGIAKNLNQKMDFTVLTNLVMNSLGGKIEDISQAQVSCINILLKEFPQQDVISSCWSNLVALLSRSGSDWKTRLVLLCQGLGSFIIMNLLKSNNEAVTTSVLGALLAVKDQLMSLEGESATKGTEFLKQAISNVTSVSTTEWSETIKKFEPVIEVPSASKRVAEPESKRSKTELFSEDEEEDQEEEEDDDWENEDEFF